MSDLPRYLEVTAALEAMIHQMGPNALLPTEDQLAGRFDVSRVTLRRALGVLERSGYISRLRGRGTIVSPPKAIRRLVPFCPIEQDFRDQGLRLETRVLTYEAAMRAAEPVCGHLGLPEGALVGHLVMIRMVEDRIICHDQRYFPPAIAAQFDPDLLASRPLPDILEAAAGKRITASDVETEIVSSPADVAKMLGITPRSLIVVNTFTEFLETGDPLNLGVMSYRIDRVRFKSTVSLPGASPAPGPSGVRGSRSEGRPKRR